MKKLSILCVFMLVACENEKKKIEVNFHNKVVDKLPIEFHSLSPYVRLNPGEESSVTYRFTNISPEKVNIRTDIMTERNSIQVMENFQNLELNEKETREVTFKFRIPSNIAKEKQKVTIQFLAKRED